jgi:predicted ATPase
MRYLKSFMFPSSDQEFDFFVDIKRRCYTNFYPFQILSAPEGLKLDFAAITILYGGNGSGKTTALNVIAQKLEALRDAPFNQSSFYNDYLNLCQYQGAADTPESTRIITSDDVFEYALHLRQLNQGIDTQREKLFDAYLDAKYATFQMKTLNDYDRLKEINNARSKTQSRFVRENLMQNLRTHSNGENAFRYFTEKIGDNGLYLLDEPENSLSPQRQLELKRFLEDAVRHFGCQIIMATHSPFLLGIQEAQIYDLDAEPVQVRPWTELPHIRKTYEFFRAHQEEFE